MIDRPKRSDRHELARELMEGFAHRTGLTGERPPRRYLWTDAFAVTNFLGLAEGGDDRGDRYRGLALRLVDQVHHVLGRHREDDPREGWLSGLADDEGERHPTAGGLRIGKEHPERRADEPYEPRLEWERDGQYFHYLTRWMHALHQVARRTTHPDALRWALELARTAQRAFTVESPDGGRRMVWKMSIALDRPQVPSMGLHDPLDGLVTYLELESAREITTADHMAGPELPDLAEEIALADSLCRGARWQTDDPLGVGGLAVDLARLRQLVAHRGAEREDLLVRLARETRASLAAWSRAPGLHLPSERRLAFRELGLAIGLAGIERLSSLERTTARLDPGDLDALLGYVTVADEIVAHWADPASRANPTWTEHEEIDSVMLATSLAPGGYLDL